MGPVRPAAPRGRGRHSSPAPSTITRPHRPLPTPQNGPTGPGLLQPPTGTPPVPPGPASPPPRPSPQPDSPREYRDLGDSRSRSALSNEMKSEGIAARPSPARGQREGGSGGGGGTSSPGPQAPNRGRRGEARAAAAASSSRAVTSTGPRTEETAARRRGNSTGINSRRARRGAQGGEREGGEPTGPFRASPQRKLTVAATAAAADRNLSPAPRGTLRRRGGGHPRAWKSLGGRRRAERRAKEQHQQGLRFLPPRPRLLFPSRERAPPAGREAGRCPRLGPRGGKRYLRRPRGGEPEAAGRAPS